GEGWCSLHASRWVVYEPTLIDEPLGMLVCSVVQSNCHDPGLLVRGRLGYRLDRVANASPCARYCWNHSRASCATWTRAPGSSKRCVAPGTIASSFSHRSCAKAARFSSMT